MNYMQQSTIRSAVSAATLACSVAFAQDKENTRPPAQPAPPPWQPVTWIDTIPRDNDEKPCVISSMQIDARVDGVFARVSETLEIRNPNTRPISAPVTFPLPDGAVVCGYALDIDGAMVDGVAVPKEKARVAFETERRRGIDPGIVEAVRGNVWRTSVYPVPASGVRRLRVDWTAPLATGPDGSSAALSLPMPDCALDRRSVSIEVADTSSEGAPTLGGFGDTSFFADANRVWRASGVETNLAPRSDLLIALPRLPDAIAAAEKTPDGDVWFCVSAKTGAATDPATASAKEPPQSFTVFWDASGSRAGVREAERSLLRSLPAAPNGDFRLVVFRDTPEPERYFSSRAELLGALTNITYDGGTDLAALAATNDTLTTTKDVQTLLFTDGMDTLSPSTENIRFKALALVSGSECDMEGLRLACGGRVLDLSTATPETIAHEILHPARFLANVVGDGVDLLQGIGQPAVGRLVVLGRLKNDAAEIRFDFGDGVMSAPISLAKSDGRPGDTVARARAAKRIAQLAPRADDNSEELLAIGREYGLASPKTSLIVLDTLAQYLKYDIEPPAGARQLHEQWLAKRPDPAKAKELETQAKKRWLTDLKRDWNERVAWHNDPMPRKRTPKSGLFDAEERAAAPVAASRQRHMPMAAMARSARRAPAMAMDMDMAAMAEEAEPMAARAPGKSKSADKQSQSSGAKIRLAAWNPKTPYLRSLKACAAAHSGTNAPTDMLYRRYVDLRASNSAAPAFFLDCAGFFFSRGDKDLARRILSNLAEMKLEDPALLRTFAWRLREAGDYDRAIAILRKVAKLRPEEPHSFRDLALLLGERAKDSGNAADAEEAMGLLKKTAFTPWKRQNARAVAVFALEELNALADWCTNREWPDGRRPAVPEWDSSFKHLLDMDLRIILSWDADNTDIDIHVLEPNGEEAFYQNRRTASGGFVSQDITTGYGPEEYLQLKGQNGVYKVLTHYYGSSQQRLTGPATATATVYTDWGRPGEKRQILSLRMDKPKEKVTVGEVTFAR